MIDTKELRKLVHRHAQAAISIPIKPAMLSELLDRLETAEGEALEEARLNGMGSEREAALMAKLESAEKELAELRSSMKFRTSLIGRTEAERDALRSKITEMERQEPVAKIRINSINGNPSVDFIPGHSYLHHNESLYALPGAKAQPAPSVPDGWKLVPIVSTDEMDNAGSDHCDGYLSTAQAVWDAMLAAAPEAKP